MKRYIHILDKKIRWQFSIQTKLVLGLIQKATLDHPKWALGNKALQKSLYFFNLEHNRFNFRWADYGPFSGEVQQIAHDLGAVGKTEIKDAETRKPDIPFKGIKCVPEHQFTIPQELDAALEKIIKFISGKSARELEFYASVHFLAKTDHDGDTAAHVHKILKDIEPDTSFTLEDVSMALGVLDNNNIA